MRMTLWFGLKTNIEKENERVKNVLFRSKISFYFCFFLWVRVNLVSTERFPIFTTKFVFLCLKIGTSDKQWKQNCRKTWWNVEIVNQNEKNEIVVSQIVVVLNGMKWSLPATIFESCNWICENELHNFCS